MSRKSTLRNRSTRATRCMRAAIETLEKRVVLDATYVPIGTSPLVQDWSDINQITLDDNWNGVSGIIGYRGDDITTATGVDPQTLVGEGTITVDVIANQPNPDTLSSGGVAEFDALANPVVALQGSGTADAPNLVFHVNTTGVSNVLVSYNLRDIDGSTDNSTQPVALQYRVGTTGDFINVPLAFIADASTGPSQATLVTPVSVTLPPEAGNQAQVQIRIITSNAVGNDEWIGVDDIVIEQSVTAGSFAFSASNYNVNENAGTATITVNRVGGSTGAVSVNFATIAGGTATANSDYTPTSGVLNFADGETTATFPVTIIDDSDQEPTETINLELSNPTGGATLGSPSTATISIVDNDTPIPSVLVNEVLINPPGDDGPAEYIELRGTAGQNLDNIYVISIEGDGGAAGTADLVFNLTGQTLGSNGLLVLASASAPWTFPAATTVVTNAVFDNTVGALENGTNSFIVVFSTVAPTAGTDLDTNNDGTLDNLPSGAVLLDGVGVNDGGAGDLSYGALVSQPIGHPNAVTRFPDNTTPLANAAFYGGWLELGSQTSTAYVSNPDNVSPNTPTGAVITPGDVNFGGTDTIAPTVEGSAFNFLTAPQNVTVDFSEDVSASFTTDDITLLNTTTNQTIPSANISISFGAGDVATITFPGYPQGALPDGNYQLTINAAGVTDAAGNPLNNGTNEVITFFFLRGDANHDGRVNISDFNILAANFNQSPRNFGQGDFNYDSLVNISDFNILAARFNTQLGPETGASSTPLPAIRSLSSPFSTKPISDEKRGGMLIEI